MAIYAEKIEEERNGEDNGTPDVEDTDNGMQEGKEEGETLEAQAEEDLEARAERQDLTQEEKLVRKFQAQADSDFTRFDSMREQWEDGWKVADYMVKCAQNRTVNASELSKGVNVDSDTEQDRANVGSTIFFRQIRQLAAQGAAVTFSKDTPFKYIPIVNNQVYASAEEADEMANQYNLLAKWTMRQDGFERKAIDLWHSLYKNGGQWVMISQKRCYTPTIRKEPVYESYQDEFGNITNVQAGEREVVEMTVKENYPSLTLLPIGNVYADPYVGSMDEHNCIIITSTRTLSSIAADVKYGYFSEKQYEKLVKAKNQYEWDGTTERNLKQDLVENSLSNTYDHNAEGIYLQYDVFMRAPIYDEEWKEDNVPVWYWATFVGNSIGNGLCLRLERNPDPDDELPVTFINALPDDSDILYHVAPYEVVRSNYSVECTLKAQAIDNMALVNNPPLMALEGGHSISDFTFKKGAFWPVNQMDAIREFQVRDTTQTTTALLEYIKNDTMQALNTDPNFMGMSYGGRTSASEANTINRNTLQPALMLVRYVLLQILPWYARKMKSYWDAYALPNQVVAITDEDKFKAVVPFGMSGEFDIDVSLIDEFEDDSVKNQQVADFLRIVGSSPAMMQYVNIPELVRMVAERLKLPVAKLITAPANDDAARVARAENGFIMQGNYLAPKQGENHQVHLAEHEGERIRYQGVEDQYPAVQLLDQHIALTKAMMQTPSTGSLPATTPVQTQGELAANPMEGMMAPG